MNSGNDDQPLSPAGKAGTGYTAGERISVRLAAIGVGSLWTYSLFLPYYAKYEGEHGARLEGLGYRLAEFGVFGPLCLTIAWYANFPFFLCVLRMLNGSPPGLKLSAISALLAFSALLPYWYFDLELTGRFKPVFLSGPAVVIWLSAFVATFAVSLAAELLRDISE